MKILGLLDCRIFFGAWIGFQTLMRRPEVDGLILIAPPVNLYDFNFLSPCPIKTMIVRAEQDEIVKRDNLKEFLKHLKNKKMQKFLWKLSQNQITYLKVS